ncbi:uncharacterized protein LOC121731012 [Aricia agestis]|uniref:uncharacterized protein LOC121731012 n=1 Tax=Aricia agestis TaxID=91739 RepID=UPI001C20AA22|nr:uncharacterized protein LOC121731012 [Aricia agestis]
MNSVSTKMGPSKRTIKLCESTWKVHEFEVWSGELICRAAAISMPGSLFVWLGGREAALSAAALGVPRAGSALASSLLGDDPAAVALARRLSAALARQVYVCSGKEFDRFTAPLVERGIVAELKKHPDVFGKTS